jgi:hypothetical protein
MSQRIGLAIESIFMLAFGVKLMVIHSPDKIPRMGFRGRVFILPRFLTQLML